MAANERFDQVIGDWLQAEAPARLPRRVLDATFERTRASRQQVGWRGRPGRSRVMQFAPLLGGVAVAVVVAAALASGFFGNRSIVGGPSVTPDLRSAFLGTWISTSDADGGTQTITITAVQEGAVEIVVTDDIASVCTGTPSTMTGTGHLEDTTRLVIPTPDYRCDDGREPKALSGPSLEEQLRGLTFVRDAQAESLTDNLGGVWLREIEATPSLDPTMPATPPTEAEVSALLNGFLEARVAGSGAQPYLSNPEEQVPLLYATSTGASYDHAEFEQVRGIEWPYGDTAYQVRLFAGTTVVEQLHFVRADRPLALEYDSHGFASDIAPTTENGLPVAMPYTALDGHVTLRAPHPWVFFDGRSDRVFTGHLIPEGPGVRPTTDGGQRIDWDEFFLIADPTLGGIGCGATPDPVSAEALAARLQSIPGVGTTAPVAVGVGEAQGLMIDVAIPAGATVNHAFNEGGDPCVSDVLRALAGDQGYTDTATGEQMRLFLLDVPEGLSVHTMAIEIVAPNATFKRAVEAAAPVVDSIEFHAS
jgi:hypothetical protein